MLARKLAGTAVKKAAGNKVTTKNKDSMFQSVGQIHEGRLTLLSVVFRLCDHGPAGGGRVGRRRASFVCNETRNAEAALDLTPDFLDPRYGVAGAVGQHVGVVGSFEHA